MTPAERNEYFVNFLEKNGVYVKYNNNFIKHCEDINVPNPADYFMALLNDSDAYVVFGRSVFSWDQTPEGYFFWAEIQKEWLSNFKDN